MTTIRNLIAIWLMLLAFRLIARRDDARSLRTAIPLTLAMVETMQGISAKALQPHVQALRDRLGEMRAKLARLEGDAAAIA